MFSYDEAFATSLEYFSSDELAAKTVIDKYLLKDNAQNLLERSPDDMHRRVASEFVRVDQKKFKKPLTFEEVYGALKGFKRIIPQGSPLYAIGNNFQIASLSNCFVLDTPCDSYGGILRTDEQLVQVSKRRGGTGLDISELRPSGAPTMNSSRTSTGIIPFMERFSNSIREVGQSGRRGALMLTCSVHHPQILDFINSKKDRTKVTGANISVRCSDEFLEAVKNDTNFELRWPVNSPNPKVKIITPASDIWNAIITSAWESGEPGVLFWDTILKNSPADCYADLGFRTSCTNPCLPAWTWVQTSEGPKQIRDLIGKSFKAVIGKRLYDCPNGFFKTGFKSLMKIHTNRGFEIDATPNHKFLVNDQWTEVKDIKSGDNISLASSDIKWLGEGTFEEGWLLGSYVGDGCHTEDSVKLCYWGSNKEDMKLVAVGAIQESVGGRSDIGVDRSIESYEERVHDKNSVKCTALYELSKQYGIDEFKNFEDKFENKSYDFYRGFLRGWFDADGTVHVGSKKGNSVRLCSIKLNNLQAAQRMLARLGIISTIYKDRRAQGLRFLPDGRGGQKEYLCQAYHELHLSGANLVKFNKLVGFADNIKADKLQKIVNSYVRKPNKERFTAKVEFLTHSYTSEVYDCQVPGINAFNANGFLSHNCGEVPLCALDSCRLLLLNAYTYVTNPFTKKAKFDFEAFRLDAMLAQRLMDNLIDLELEKIDAIIEKIKLDPELCKIKRNELDLWLGIRLKCVQGRRTGTGLTGIGDALAALGLKYDSDKAISAIDEIYECLKFSTYESSIEMAKELGAFEIFDYEREKDHPYLKCIYEKFPEMQKYGRRNIALLTTAPAGSMSIIAGTTGGIEPLFKIDPYIRRKKINPSDENTRVDFKDQNGDSWQEFEVYHSKIQTWMQVTGETDIKKSPWFGSCANDLDPKRRVKLQATAQKHIDHSISSTVNLPEDISVDKVKEIYETAWKLGCKGVTVYRDKCRTGVLVEKRTDNFVKRPIELPCDIHFFKIKNKQFFTVVGIKDSKPYEVFAGENGHLPHDAEHGTITKLKRGHYKVTTDKGEIFIKDTEKMLDENAAVITRLISTSLRHGVAMHFIVEQLEKVEGDFQSFSKCLARTMKKYIKNLTKVSGQDCIVCGNINSLVYSEGCVTCGVCGWSKCG